MLNVTAKKKPHRISWRIIKKQQQSNRFHLKRIVSFPNIYYIASTKDWMLQDDGPCSISLKPVDKSFLSLRFYMPLEKSGAIQ